MEISLSKILKILIQKLWLIVLIALICGLTAFAVSEFFIKPSYKSETEFFVSKKDTSGATNDLTYAKQIVPDYISYISGDIFIKDICDNLNAKSENIQFDVKTIKKMIEITPSKTSATFSLTVKANTPQSAYLVCKAFSDNTPIILKNVFEYSNIITINPPIEENSPVSPNKGLNTAVGIILGLILAVTLVILMDRLDNSIKDEFDITDNYNLPLIGIVYTHKPTKNTSGA